MNPAKEEPKVLPSEQLELPVKGRTVRSQRKPASRWAQPDEEEARHAEDEE